MIKFDNIEIKDGILKVKAEGNPFIDNAPEEIKEHIKPMFKYMKKFGEEATKEATKFAEKHLSKNKDIDEVIAEVPYGPSARLDTLTTRVQRSVKTRNIKTGEEYQTPRVSVKVKSSAFPGKTHLKKLKDEMLKDIK